MMPLGCIVDKVTFDHGDKMETRCSRKSSQAHGLMVSAEGHWRGT